MGRNDRRATIPAPSIADRARAGRAPSSRSKPAIVSSVRRSCGNTMPEDPAVGQFFRVFASVLLLMSRRSHPAKLNERHPTVHFAVLGGVASRLFFSTPLPSILSLANAHNEELAAAASVVTIRFEHHAEAVGDAGGGGDAVVAADGAAGGGGVVPATAADHVPLCRRRGAPRVDDW
jgi:hypothetical protein